MIGLLREVLSLIRNLPDLIARWCDRQVLAAHQPEMVPAGVSEWPSGEQPWCLRCDEAWPCDGYAVALVRTEGRSS